MAFAAALALLAAAPAFHVTATVRGHTDVPSPARIAARMPAAVAFFTPRSGLLSFPDGRVLRTRDGGRTWTAARGIPLRAIDVVGTWKPLPTPCGRFETLYVALAGAARGFALCGGQPATIEQRKRLYST